MVSIEPSRAPSLESRETKTAEVMFAGRHGDRVFCH